MGGGRQRVEEHFTLTRRTRRLEPIYNEVLPQRERTRDAGDAHVSAGEVTSHAMANLSALVTLMKRLSPVR